MKFLDAAYEVLRHAGQPLHYIDIFTQARTRGLVTTRGKTPEATMGALLYTDCKRADSRFRKVGKATFTLSESRAIDDIAGPIAAINDRTRAALRRRLHDMPPDRFEVLIGQLLVAVGFDEDTVEVTKYHADGGVDVRGVFRAAGITESKVAVQAKRWKGNVGSPVVAKLAGSITVDELGIIITTGGFSAGAQHAASAVGKKPIGLVDGEQLLDLLIEHEIGVTAEQHTLLSVDEEWWGEIAGEPEQRDAEPKPPLVTSPRVTYPLVVKGSVRGVEVIGQMMDAGGTIRVGDSRYGSPSAAGQAATGWKSCNGWSWWRYRDPETGEWRLIDGLRG
jgi:restriction system protein